MAPAVEGVNAGVEAGVDDKEYVEWIVTQFEGRRRERMLGPCVVLDMCFTHPDYHRRGAGKMLLEWGTKKADELGVKGFVEASIDGRQLYEKYGFVVTEHVRLRGGDQREEWKEYGEVAYYFMERAVRKGGS